MWIFLPSAVSVLEVAFLSLLSSALLSCRSCSPPSIPAGHVMKDRLGSFNVEELDSNLYSVVISREPVMAPAATIDKERVDSDDREHEQGKKQVKMSNVGVVSRYGQRYTCAVPDASHSLDATDSDETSDTSDRVDTGDTNHFPNVSKLLALLKTRPCLTKTIGWWTYEYCHGRFIRQYHLEAGHLTGKTLYMGHYVNETVWDKKNIDKIERTLKTMKNNMPQKTFYMVYHTVLYNNGTQCDITHKPRTTTVKISCGVSGKDKLVSIHERGTCDYIVSVHTSLLCNIPLFSNTQLGKEESIVCSPVVSEETYQEHLRRKKEKETKVMEKFPKMEAQWSEPPSPLSSLSNLAIDGFQTDQTAPEHEVPLTPSPDSVQTDDGIISLQEAMRSLLEVLNAQTHLDKTKDERLFLLKKLISKVQPDLSDEEVNARVKSLQEKFRYFNIEQLRELAGEIPEKTSSDHEAINAEKGNQKDSEEAGKLREWAGVLPEKTSSGKTISTEEETQKDGLPGRSPMNPLGATSVGSPKNFAEEYLNEDEQTLLDSLDLDEDELAELESSINAELVERLNKMGIQAEDTKVKIKLMKLSDLDLDWDDEDDDDEDEDESETSVEVADPNAPLGSSSKKSEVKDSESSEEREKASALEEGYKAFWEEDREHRNKKKSATS